MSQALRVRHPKQTHAHFCEVLSLITDYRICSNSSYPPSLSPLFEGPVWLLGRLFSLLHLTAYKGAPSPPSGSVLLPGSLLNLPRNTHSLKTVKLERQIASALQVKKKLKIKNQMGSKVEQNSKTGNVTGNMMQSRRQDCSRASAGPP